MTVVFIEIVVEPVIEVAIVVVRRNFELVVPFLVVHGRIWALGG